MSRAEVEIPEQILADIKAMLHQMHEQGARPQVILVSEEFFKGVVMPVVATPQTRFNRGEAWRRNGKKRGRR